MFHKRKDGSGAWDNLDNTPADQSSTDIKYTEGNVSVEKVLHSGNHHLNVLSYNLNGTPSNGIKISTNIPYSNGSQMPSVILEGYCYGQAKPIQLHIVWYVYGGNFINHKVISNSSYRPEIQLANEGGKVVIFVNDRQYYSRFTVRAFAQGMSEQPSWFEGWTVADAAITGLPNTVTVPYDGGTATGPLAKSAYGGNWLWGGWTTPYTANVALTNRGWVTAFTTTAPNASAGTVFDMTMDGNFGQMINYSRECRTRNYFGWRLLVNGAVVGTRTTTCFQWFEGRTNLGNETIAKYEYTDIGSFHWVRNAVPPGATIEIQFVHQVAAEAMQTNGYARFIAGVYRECNFLFMPRNLITA